MPFKDLPRFSFPCFVDKDDKVQMNTEVHRYLSVSPQQKGLEANHMTALVIFWRTLGVPVPGSHAFWRVDKPPPRYP